MSSMESIKESLMRMSTEYERLKLQLWLIETLPMNYNSNLNSLKNSIQDLANSVGLNLQHLPGLQNSESTEESSATSREVQQTSECKVGGLTADKGRSSMGNSAELRSKQQEEGPEDLRDIPDSFFSDWDGLSSPSHNRPCHYAGALERGDDIPETTPDGHSSSTSTILDVKSNNINVGGAFNGVFDDVPDSFFDDWNGLSSPLENVPSLRKVTQRSRVVNTKPTRVSARLKKSKCKNDV